MKYRKKPVVIDAVMFHSDSYQLCKDFCPILHAYEHPKSFALVGTIQTLEGMMEVQEGDYIIKGIKGEFYPCKPDIFEATYEKVE